MKARFKFMKFPNERYALSELIDVLPKRALRLYAYLLERRLFDSEWTDSIAAVKIKADLGYDSTTFSKAKRELIDMGLVTERAVCRPNGTPIRGLYRFNVVPIVERSSPPDESYEEDVALAEESF